MTQDPSALVGEYHRNLPDHIIEYLHSRGISDEIITLHRLGWNGQRITIPVINRDGTPVGFKLGKDPADNSVSPKMLTTRGTSLELYGWERVLAKPQRLVICEGEFDRLVLETHGIAAVTSTGGAGAFRPEWAADFASIPEVFLCFDRDEAGRRGALRVGHCVSHAKIVALPDEVGPSGDVTDFFVRLGRTRDDFEKLLDSATPVPALPPALPVHAERAATHPSAFSLRIRALKQQTPIADVVSRYVRLRPSGLSWRGRCLFHDDHDPSLMVYPEGGAFRCYGCGRHGDAIDFLMAVERVSFLRALDLLEGFQSEQHGQRSGA
jgi:DNA primase